MQHSKANFDGNLPAIGQPVAAGGSIVEIESARAVQEVQAALVIAKKFPRDQNAAYTKIMTACQRMSLAEKATFAYPRGNEIVSGPTIRLAEVLAQCWGNIQFGIKEVSRKAGVSEVVAYAWDLETNTRRAMEFTVEHKRHTKSGSYALTDPRDIYEMIANQGSRRLRACIMGVIPGDIQESATKKCEETLAKGGDEPLADRIRKMVAAFAEMGVSQQMIEKRLRHRLEATVPAELVGLQQVYRAIKDGMGALSDYFEVEEPKAAVVTDDGAEMGQPAVEQVAADPAKIESAMRNAKAVPGLNQAAADIVKLTDGPDKDRLKGLYGELAAALKAGNGNGKKPVAPAEQPAPDLGDFPLAVREAEDTPGLDGLAKEAEGMKDAAARKAAMELVAARRKHLG